MRKVAKRTVVLEQWNNDYDSLKKEILSRNGLKTFGMAQRVHGWSFQTDQPPHAQFHKPMHLTKK